MSDPELSRRDFLAGGSALVIGVAVAGHAGARPALVNPRAPGGAPFSPNAFVRIGADDIVTIVSKHFEMGQGPYTGLATLVAEELDAEWSQVRVVSAPANDALYGNTVFGGRQGTGGSTAIREAHAQMRQAGAAARQMLVEAAAEAWGVPAGEITTEAGQLRHASGPQARYGAFVEAAATRRVPDAPTLKDAKDFRLIGKELPRVDTAAKSDGSAMFTIDAYRDEMLVVTIERPPLFGATVKSFDAKAALATPGVEAVKALPQGVAVYAQDTWSSLQGRKALVVEWDERAAETRSSDELIAELQAAAKAPGVLAAEKGDAAGALGDAAARDDIVTAEAEFVFPYLAHAMMEPLHALVEVDPEDPGGVLVTMGSQGPGRDHPAIAETLGLPLDKVRLDVQMGGGSFGRRSTWDAHFPREAATVFQEQPGDAAKRRPTKLQWTREDDIRGGYYRPIVVHRMRGAMTREGTLVGWDQTIAAQSWMKGTPLEGALARTGGIDRTVVEGANNLAYAAEHLRVSQHLFASPAPVLWWRSVGHTHTGHAVEVFIDELLEKAGRDPVEGRLALMADQPRHQAALRLAAEAADWGRALPDGRAFGVAVHESFRSVVAQIVELEVAASGPRRPRVRRVWCAVDCGLAVNPNVIRAQMEGGIGFGLGAALYSEIQLEPGGRVREGNFDRYQALRIDDMPEVEVRIVASDAPPTGVGEPGVPPISPAVVNGWRRLTGERVARLPFVRQG